MPTYVRRRERGATYFFTVVTYRRQRILTGDMARPILRRATPGTSPVTLPAVRPGGPWL